MRAWRSVVVALALVAVMGSPTMSCPTATRSGHGLDSICPDSEQVATVAAALMSTPRTTASALVEAQVYYTSSDAVGWPRAYMAYFKSHPDEEVSAASFFAEEEAAQQAAGLNVYSV